MSDQAPAGQETPTGDDGHVKKITELEGIIKGNDVTITRLRGTQSSNDRTITDMKAAAELLNASVADLTAQNQALVTDKDSLTTTNAGLSTQLERLGPLTTELEDSKRQYARLTVAASLAGESPVIASLIANKSLPAVEDPEAFAAALKNIAGSVKLITSTAATDLLKGAKPGVLVPSGDGSKTPDSLRKQASLLMKKKEGDAAIALMQEADALEQSLKT